MDWYGHEDDEEALQRGFQGEGGAGGDPGRPDAGELAAKHGVHHTMIAAWKRQLSGSLSARARMAATPLAYQTNVGSHAGSLTIFSRTRTPPTKGFITPSRQVAPRGTRPVVGLQLTIAR